MTDHSETELRTLRYMRETSSDNSGDTIAAYDKTRTQPRGTHVCQANADALSDARST
jgi:hypothetical protein